MKHLAELIRKGLETPGIVEDNEIFGAAFYEGELHANTVGLALIGKIGVERSIVLFELSLKELGRSPSPVSDKILTELGTDTDTLESMVMTGFRTPALEIAQKLEANGVL